MPSLPNHQHKAIPVQSSVTKKQQNYDQNTDKSPYYYLIATLRPLLNHRPQSTHLSIQGPSPNAGHYFAFSRLNLLKDSKWVCHNDAEVSELESYADVQQFM